MTAAEVKSMAAEIQAESKARADRLARSVFGDVPYGADALTKKAFLDMLRRNWADPKYRMALGGYFDQQGLYHPGRISAEAFLNAAQAAGLIPEWQAAAKQLEAPIG